MKKKFLSVFLVFVFLIGLALPTGATEQEAVSVLEPSGEPVPIPTAEVQQQSKRPWDYIGEVSLIEAAPSTRNLAAQIPHSVTLCFFLRDSGSANTYFCVDIYAENSSSPVAEIRDVFPGEQGIYAYEVVWATAGFDAGAYRIVMYTATLSGERYVPVTGTKSEVTVLLANWFKPLDSISLIDPDTRQAVPKVALAANELGCLEIVESPSYNTYNREFRFSGNTLCVGIEEWGGLLFLTPRQFGWGNVTVTDIDRNSLTQFEVEVCINPGGHINVEETRLSLPDSSRLGVVLQCCPDCGSTRLKYEPSFLSVFHHFVDVPADQWFYEGVRSAVVMGLFNGVSEQHFGPEALMTRSMLVTVLWRYAGEPASGDSPFTDVPDGLWYSEAIAWAAEQGVVGGVGDGRFDPEGTLTREQLATILYRYAVSCGLELEAPDNALNNFPDQNRVSDYAKVPLCWAVSSGIIGGTKEGNMTYLDPLGNATRAQVAVMLTRFIENCFPDSFPEAPLPSPDTLLEHGSVRGINWEFYENGTLAISGDIVPSFGPEWGSVDERPWEHLVDRITRLDIREGIVSIGKNAFSDFSALTEVSLPHSLQVIEPDAFASCTSLEQIVIPEGTLHLIGSVFRNCTSLREVSLPISIRQRTELLAETYMPFGLFSGCSALESITLPPATEKIPGEMFRDCISLKELHLGDGTEVIEADAFLNCSSVESIIMPYYLKTLEDCAFSKCSSLTALVFTGPWTTVKPSSIINGQAVYSAPFGSRKNTVVYAYSGTEVAELAVAEGYAFVPLESVQNIG